ncbi:MAG: PilZ domain-containing protein [Gammaproteobacteria bacterium]|uniref:PilZ domain-containing protein n=1 Tax=hydrothermal vent metagenome TaxID=652676 RepID=A0A3B0ZTR6_9ZZZZ|nr:PilZ domain-containing protein [Gammaproteobacteria bacterium]
MVTSSEKRVSERYLITEIAENSGAFHLCINETSHEISDIQDVSVTGVRILMEMPLPEGSPAILSYQADDLEMSIETQIIWSELDDENGLFLTGIRFNPIQTDLSTLFFLAFRKQLDRFDKNIHILQS